MDFANRQRTIVLWSEEGKVVSVLTSKFASKLPRPDKYGRTEFWVPTRAVDYNSKTGRLESVHTYDQAHFTPGKAPQGYQTTYHIPADFDFAKLRNQSTGAMRYTGAAEYCTLMYDCKPAGTQTIEILEPFNNSEYVSCFKASGETFALRNGGTTIHDEPTSTEDESVPQVEPNPTPAHETCFDKVCVQVYEGGATEVQTSLPGEEENN